MRGTEFIFWPKTYEILILDASNIGLASFAFFILTHLQEFGYVYVADFYLRISFTLLIFIMVKPVVSLFEICFSVVGGNFIIFDWLSLILF